MNEVDKNIRSDATRYVRNGRIGLFAGLYIATVIAAAIIAAIF